MNRVYLHYQRKLSLNTTIFILLIPFLVIGLNKNGLLLYKDGFVNLFMAFKPVILVLIALVETCIFNLIFKKKIDSYDLLEGILIAMVTPFNTNILIFMILIFMVNLLKKFIKGNPVCIYMVLTMLVSMFMKNYTFNNILEQSTVYHYYLGDYLIGKGIGGIANTFLFMDILSLICFSFNLEYKKEIPILGLIIFYLLLITTTLITKNFNLDLYLNNNLIFALIFIAPMSFYSPYTKGSSILYGFSLGLAAYIFSFIDLNFGVYFSILILSYVFFALDKAIVNKHKQEMIEVL